MAISIDDVKIACLPLNKLRCFNDWIALKGIKTWIIFLRATLNANKKKNKITNLFKETNSTGSPLLLIVSLIVCCSAYIQNGIVIDTILSKP